MPRAAAPTFPTRLQSIAATIEGALLNTSDGLIRVEFTPRIDLDGLFAELDPKCTRRFGILRPFEYSGKRKKGLSRDPREVTRWRNAPIAERRASPVIVLGRATGREEAGLRRIRTVITETDVLATYERLGRQWLARHVAEKTKAPERFFEALVVMAKERSIDADLLSEMCSVAFKDPASAHVMPQRELWRVHLIPDERAQDSKTPGVRFSLNQSVTEFLRSAADSAADQKKWERLEQRAEDGDAVASAALQYARTRKREHLMKVQLDALLAALAASKSPGAGEPGPNDPEPRVSQLDLFEFLDRGAGNTVEVLQRLAKELELDAEDETAAEVEADDTTNVYFGPQVVEPEWPLTRDNAQVVYTVRLSGSDPDSARIITDEQLRQAAQHTAFLIATQHAKADKPAPTLAAMVDDYLVARTATMGLVRWAADMLAILILDQQALEQAERYLSTWLTLVSAVLSETEVAHTRQLREHLVMLDAAWEYADVDGSPSFIGCQLCPIHPFVLGPAVELARFVRDHLGETELGSQVLWALDRSSPAYPAVWAPDAKLLLHAGGAGWPRFEIRPRGSRRPVSRAQGLVDVVRSYVGLHPYSQRCLSILLFDPPEGSGIPSALKAIARLVDRVKIYVVSTPGVDGSELLANPDVHNLGRVSQLEPWASQLALRVNILVSFQSARRTGVHPGKFHPSPGLHNVLTVSTTSPGLLEADANPDATIPYVSMQPREANEIVKLFLELARGSSNEDRFYEIRPMLRESEAADVVAVSKLADWLVLATPSPIGLIPPLRFGEDDLVFLGREDLAGSYALFVYARDLFSIRRRVQQELIQTPLQASSAELERQLQQLAMAVPNGVLRIGRGEKTVTPQIGMMAAAFFARGYSGG